MKPTANAPVMPAIFTIAKQASGSSTKWHSIPTSSARGCLTMRLKSTGVRPSPSENMMNARQAGIRAIETLSTFMESFLVGPQVR